MWLDREGQRSVAGAAQAGGDRGCRRRGGRGRSPARSKTSISSGMRGLAAHVADLRCRDRGAGGSGAHCGRVNWHRQTTRRGGPRVRSRRRRRLPQCGRAVRQDPSAGGAARIDWSRLRHALAAGRPSIAVGGKRLWRNRNHLDAAGMTEQQWRDQLGRSADVLDCRRRIGQGRRQRNHPRRRRRAGCGSRCPRRPGATSSVRIVVIGEPIAVHPPRRRMGRANQLPAARCATTSPSTRPGTAGIWTRLGEHDSRTSRPDSMSCAHGRVLGVDLNADHLACCVLDGVGQPGRQPALRSPSTPPVWRASRRDGRVRASITAVLAGPRPTAGCTAVAMENLDFADARATGRDTMGRGTRGKRFRRTVAGIPTARIPHPTDRDGRPPRHRDHQHGSACTSNWGTQRWAKPLQQQTSKP